MTYGAGKFIFSCAYDSDVILPKAIEAGILYSTISELPILPTQAAQLQKDLMRRSIFGTAAIEGNKLTEHEVSKVLSDEAIDSYSEIAEKEISNLKIIYDLLTGKKEDEAWKLEEKFIKRIHEILTTGLNYRNNSPGNYRNEAVCVGNDEHGGIYTPPKKLDDVRNLMTEFIEWINCEEMLALDPMVRACVAHFHLAKIHPFRDGNGRTARIVEAIILDKAGIKYLPQMMSNFYYQNIDDYFIAFSKTHRTKQPEDITPFLSFYYDGIIQSLKEIKDQVTFSIRILSLKDFYYFLKKEKKITQRQLEFLLIALKTAEKFSLDDLFENPIIRNLYRDVSRVTARRDLKKLYDNNLLRKDDQNFYQINFFALG